ncbi:MAG: squalene synthase HpnC [Rubripirellula sp.]
MSRDPGAASSRQAESLRLAERMTRELATSHYENFLVASILLPRKVRQPFYNVYAYCRTADDLADESPTPEVALAELDRFQICLEEAFAGEPSDPLFLALATTIEQFQLSKQPFLDLLDAFRQDQTKHHYASIDELLDYCRRSANPVGRIVLQLGDSIDEENLRYSDLICSGLQLANFWQDVGRDYEMGRIYLPSDQMARFGVEESMLADKSTPRSLRKLLAEECDRAEEMFRKGLPLAGRVVPWLANDIKLFAHGGLQTLEAIRRVDYDVLRERPKVSKWGQAKLVLRALARRL